MDIKLVMFKPDGQRKDIPVTTATTIIGRGEKCELRVPLLSVSRRHCELSIDGEFLQVKDLGSANGTYVNDKRINEADLQPGDRLAIGPVVFTIQIDGSPELISPVEAGEDIEQATVDDVLDLETDMGPADNDALKTEVSLAPQAPEEVDDLSDIFDDDDDELDPIAALEALAAEKDKEKDKDKKDA